MVNPLESVRVGKNLVERPALNGDHNFLQKIHEHQFDAQDKALATSGVVDCEMGDSCSGCKCESKKQFIGRL
ncbi:MAG: hypothetical protein GQ533_00040 [Methanosarcinaceae archaeon]|nr:hypothetical protein [Methanosarcinaceae archaeon]